MPLRRLLPWGFLVVALLGQPVRGQQWVRTLTLSDQGGEWTLALRFGVWPGASDGIDPLLGETVLPPWPPAGVPHAVFIGPGLGNGVYVDLRSSSTGVEHVLTLYLQRASAAPAVISWDRGAIAAATTSARLRDTYGGVLLDVDMAAVDQVVVDHTALYQFELAFVSSALNEGALATRLHIAAPQAGATITSGSPMPPVLVHALSDEGSLAEDFDGLVTLSLASGMGQLAGALQAAASAGVARFEDVTYRASADGQAFVLRATGGSLRPGEARYLADVVATRLRFIASSVPPEVRGGRLVPRPTVVVEDADGHADLDYVGQVILSLSSGSGQLAGTLARAAVGGLVVYDDVTYVPAADETELALAAADSSGLLLPAIGEVYAIAAAVDSTGADSSGADSTGADSTGADSTGGVVTAVADQFAAAAVVLPERFSLIGAYPNPFNSATHLVYDLPAAAEVRVEVFSLSGQCVLRHGPLPVPAGSGRQIDIRADGLASGVYLYRISAVAAAEQWRATGKMLLLR